MADWGTIVDLLERDIERKEQKEGRRRMLRQREGVRKEQQRREVVGLIHQGQVGKAMDRVISHGVADAHEPWVQEQLWEKFPDRCSQLPGSVAKLEPIDSFPDLKSSLLSLVPGTSPGAGGCRPEYLIALGERLSKEELSLL